MYVAPRPEASTDPNYALRLALTGMLSYVAVVILNPVLPAVIAALPVGLVGAQRKAFNVGKAIGGPIAMIVMVYVMTALVELLRPMPWVYVSAMWLIYFFGFLMILQTGTQAGMLIIIITVLMSVMGMNGNATVEFLRDGFVQASLVCMVLAPLVYAIIPPNTQEQHIDEPMPHQGNNVVGAAIRASVLLGLSFWLYAVMQPSDMMMAVIAALVLVFPTRQTVFFEAKQRIMATAFGTFCALLTLVIFSFVSHLYMLLGVIFLCGLWLGHLMMYGKQPSMVYQYALSVMLALVAGAVATQDAGYAAFTRVILTLAGAFAAAFTVALLDALLEWQHTQPLEELQ